MGGWGVGMEVLGVRCERVCACVSLRYFQQNIYIMVIICTYVFAFRTGIVMFLCVFSVGECI
jgi:hypothetical protein